MLRHHGCKLPIQWWYQDESELLPYMAYAARGVGATLQSFSEVAKSSEERRLPAFARKPFSIARCPFDEVMLLDADIVVTADPTYLFDCKEYQEHGSLFWPDIGGPGEDAPIWKCCSIKPDFSDRRYRFGFQGGQQIIHKSRCVEAMKQTLQMNMDHEMWYQLTFGEQDLYRMAWFMTGTPFHMVEHPAQQIPHTILEYDPSGNLIFQHRCGDKWRLGGDRANRAIPGFLFERECFEYLAALGSIVDGQLVAA